MTRASRAEQISTIRSAV